MSTRNSYFLRSEAIAAIKCVELPNTGLELENAETRSDFEPGEPRKKRKTGKSVARAKKLDSRLGPPPRIRKLTKLPSMPWDILFEIFGQLDPYDVLRLARTTKSLRDILMRRSAISIWKQTLSNLPIQLPACPPDLSEPQFISLAFEPYCHFCFAPHVYSAMWAFRVRCCRKCLPTRFVEIYQVSQMMAHIPLHALELIPRSSQKVGGENYHWPRDYYRRSDAKLLIEQYTALKDSEIPNFVEKKKKAVSELLNHAKLCENWLIDRGATRSREIEAARQRRKNAIFKKLAEIGWDEEVEILNRCNPARLSTHALINQAKDLTERIWKNIRPGLVEFMEEIKLERLKQNHRAVVKRRRDFLVNTLKAYSLTRPRTEIIPLVADVYHMDGVKSVFEASSSVEIPPESSADILQRLPRLSEEWRISKARELLALMPAVDTPSRASMGAKTDDFSRLALAKTFFDCYKCNDLIPYPRILAHSCMTSLQESAGEKESYECFLVLGSELWNRPSGRASFSKPAELAAKSVILGCGLDPEIARADEMNSREYWLECLACDNATGRLVMRWNKAVHHFLGHTSESHAWSLLSDADVLKAENHEKVIRDRNPHIGEDYGCTRCMFRHSFATVCSHIQREHSIREVTNEDYYLHIDTPARIAVRIPHEPQPE